MKLNEQERLYLKELIKLNLEEVGIRVGDFVDGSVQILNDQGATLGYIKYAQYFDVNKFYDMELFMEAFSFVLRDTLSLTQSIGEILIDSPSYFHSFQPKETDDFFCGYNLFDCNTEPLAEVWACSNRSVEDIEEFEHDNPKDILLLGETFSNVSVRFAEKEQWGYRDHFFIYPTCKEFKTYKKFYYPIYESRAKMLSEMDYSDNDSFYTWTNIDYYYIPKKEDYEADLAKAKEALKDVVGFILNKMKQNIAVRKGDGVNGQPLS